MSDQKRSDEERGAGKRQQRLEYTRLAPAGIAPMRALEHYLNAESGLETVLLELIRLRVSLLNGCTFCVGLHTHELRRHNEPQSRIEGLARWTESDAYTQREQAALRWAEVLTRIGGEVPEEEFAAVQRHFSGKELVDLTLAITSINAWNRLGVAFLPQWDESKAGVGRTPGAEGQPQEDDRGTGDFSSRPSETTSEKPADDDGKVAQDEAVS